MNKYKKKTEADASRTGMRRQYPAMKKEMSRLKGSPSPKGRKAGGATLPDKNQYKVQPATTGKKTAMDGPKGTLSGEALKKKEGGRTYGNTKN
jgi:hypothetical protein